MGIPGVDLARMASRVAAEPRRRAILTTRANADSEAPGRPQMRKMSELVEHLEKSRYNAVLIESGDGWVAVYTDISSGSFAVAKVPMSDPANVLAKKVPDAASAVSAAMQLA